MDAFAPIVEIMIRELGAKRAAHLTAAAGASALEQATINHDEGNGDESPAVLFAEALWDALGREKPDAFDGRRSSRWSWQAHALAYALKRERQHVQPLQMTRAEREALTRARQIAISWSGLCPWVRARHLAFNDKSSALRSFQTIESPHGGIAFPFHRGLARTALYSQTTIDELRNGEFGVVWVSSILLHEEAHLTVARHAGGDGTGILDPLAGAIFETAAQLIELVAFITAGLVEPPTLKELLVWSQDLSSFQRCARLIRLLDCDTAEGAVRDICGLAVIAARGGDAALADEAIARIRRKYPRRALRNALR